MPLPVPPPILASLRRLACAACLFTLLVPAARAQEGSKPQEALLLNTHGFMAAHPDLRWRQEGMAELRRDQPVDALAYFKRAARFADKPSQAMVAEMLWTGRGVPADRALAYAWMDLAAERAYLPFLAMREQYWKALDAGQRERALALGVGVYAEYGDAVAKPRLERKLRFGRQVTGSRTGFVGSLKIVLPGGTIDGSHYYDPEYWEPEEYWARQDRIWSAPRRTGNVRVRPLEVVPEPGEAQPDAGNDTGD